MSISHGLSSDERSGSELLDRIKAAVSMDSFGGLPNAVIIDEIDGACDSSSEEVSVLVFFRIISLSF